MKLSIIVPMFNAEKNIEQTILSALPYCENQSELILVDDGSEDATKSICEKYADSRVKVMDNIHEKGVSGARNTGLDVASGDYVAFLDSDDQFTDGLKSVLTCLEETLEFHNNLEDSVPQVVLYGYEIRDFHGTMRGSIQPAMNQMIPVSDFINKHLERMSGQWLINPCWNKLYKRDFISDNKILFPEKMNMGEDLNFVLQCLKKAKQILVCDMVGYTYRQYDGNRLTGAFRLSKLEMQTDNYQRYLELQERYPEFSLEAIRQQFYDDIQSFIDDAYYLSGYSLRQAKRVLENIMNNELQMRVIRECNTTDWKQLFLQQGRIDVLHRKMAWRKWKGKLSKWIRNLGEKKE